MKFCTHIIYIKKSVWQLYNIRVRSAYPTYLQHAGIRNMCAKFYQDSSKAERLVCVITDRRTDRVANVP